MRSVGVAAHHRAEPDAGVLGQLDTLPITCALSATQALARRRELAVEFVDGHGHVLAQWMHCRDRANCWDAPRAARPRARCASRPGRQGRARRAVLRIDPVRSTARLRADPSRCRHLPGRPARPLLVPRRPVPPRSPAHPRGPRRAAACHRAHRVQRHQPRARRGLALRRHARGLLPRLGARGREEAQHFTLLREHLHARPSLWRLRRPRRPLGHVREDRGRRRGADGAGAAHAGSARAGRHAADPGQAAPRRRRGRAVEILDIILRDEVGHVAIGNRWYRWLCERAGSTRDAYAVLAPRTPRRGCARRSTSTRGARPASRGGAAAVGGSAAKPRTGRRLRLRGRGRG